MADYSEFPTTPTAWQEITALETEDAPPPATRRRAVDWVALIPGLLFVALAITLMTGIELFLFENGGDAPRALKHFERSLSLNPNQVDVQQRVNALPGVEAAGIVRALPLATTVGS